MLTLEPIVTHDQTVNVEAYSYWTFSKNVTWLTVTEYEIGDESFNGMLIVTADPNTGTMTRTGAISVTNGTTTSTVSVSQPAIQMNVSAATLTFAPVAPPAQTLNITANVAWTVSKDADWLTVISSATDGNNGMLTVTAESNTGAQRTGAITVSNGTTTQSVTVTQTATTEITLSTNTLAFEADTLLTQTVNVAAYPSWTATPHVDWLIATPSLANGTLTVTAAANTGATTRTGTITVSNGTTTKNIQVSQTANQDITLSTDSLVFAATEVATKTVNVTAYTAWTVSKNPSDATWLTFSPASSGIGNGTLTVTTTAINTVTTERTCTITISNGTTTKTISVTQHAANHTLDVSEASLTFDAATSTQTVPPSQAVNVMANIAWTVSMPPSDATWLNVTPLSGIGDGTLTVRPASTNTGATRMCIITVVNTLNPTMYQAIAVTQSASTGITLSTNTLNFEADTLLTQTVNVTAYSNCTATPHVDWLVTSIDDSGTLTVTAAPNDSVARTGTITISNGTTTKSIQVSQKPNPQITLTPASLSFSPTETAAKTVNVTAYTSWDVSTNDNWLTVTSTSTSGNGTLTVTAASNESTTPRTGTITVSNGSTTQTVSVTQTASTEIILSPASLSFGPTQTAAKTVNVTAYIPWTVSQKDDWLTVITSGTDGNGTLTVTAANNTGATTRTGYITVTNGTTTQTVSVTQANPQITLSTASLTFEATEAGAKTVNITANTIWTVSKDAIWLTVNVTGNLANATLIITAATPYTGATTRTGTITVTDLNGTVSKTIQVSQNPNPTNITLSQDTLHFPGDETYKFKNAQFAPNNHVINFQPPFFFFHACGVGADVGTQVPACAVWKTACENLRPQALADCGKIANNEAVNLLLPLLYQHALYCIVIRQNAKPPAGYTRFKVLSRYAFIDIQKIAKFQDIKPSISGTVNPPASPGITLLEGCMREDIPQSYDVLKCYNAVCRIVCIFT
jgi:hypothetical protein